MKAIGTRRATEPFKRILALLREQTNVDFTLYKEATLLRRMKRRMAAAKCESLNEYHRYLRMHPTETKSLFNDILIQVTSFFRDPAVFKWLNKNYLPQLVRANSSEGPIRIWVPACSTGEEVYSLAIALVKLTEGKKDFRPIQIFGTDINEMVLEKARSGIYYSSIQRQLSPQQLQRFFEPANGGFRIRKNIRDLCIFARQNLMVDPPFSNLDLISCRNLLIYLSPVLQDKILPIFHFALKPSGLLLLGTSETIGHSTNLFCARDKTMKVYSKKAGALKMTPEAHVHALQRGMRVHELSSVTQKTLKPTQIREAVDKIVRRNVGVGADEARVVPLAIPQTQDKFYVVFVDPKSADKSGALKPERIKRQEGKSERVENARLREELSAMHTAQQANTEQQEATNEELRAANEEIVSSNEELQSTNEELESAKEELQSANEELTTLNNELESRNVELEQANIISSHFKALVDSSDDAIIAKDLNGIIKSWNHGAEKIFGYTPQEIIGKPVTILIPPEQHDEEPAILARIRSGERIEHYETVRVRKDGRRINISLTVSPVKNSTGQITGASKIARDITEKKRWEVELKNVYEEAEKANRAKDDFLATLSHELRTPLNPVLLIASDSAADPEVPAIIRANFDIIRRNVELEARLIDDLLDLTRVKTGKIKIEKRDVDIHAVLSDTIAMVQSEIGQKKITLTQKLFSAQSIISGDTTRLQQILWNVLKNAIKFTPPEGTITVESHVENGYYVVRISDSGIGMTPQELACAFDTSVRLL